MQILYTGCAKIKKNNSGAKKLNKAREKGRLLAPGILVTTVLFTKGIIRNKLSESLKLLSLRPGLYILMQKSVVVHNCRIVRTIVAEQ